MEDHDISREMPSCIWSLNYSNQSNATAFTEKSYASLCRTCKIEL